MTEITLIDALNRLADEAEDRRQLDAARAEDDYLSWEEVKTALCLPAGPEWPR